MLSEFMLTLAAFGFGMLYTPVSTTNITFSDHILVHFLKAFSLVTTVKIKILYYYIIQYYCLKILSGKLLILSIAYSRAKSSTLII